MDEGPKDKKEEKITKEELLEKNPYLDPQEADLINDDDYIDSIAIVFEQSGDDLDEDGQMRSRDEDSILAEFGYIDPREEDDN